jgi:hypothetical protein
MADPDGRVRDVVFPVATLDTLSAIIREHKTEGTFERQVHAALRASYAGHYRRMLPAVLSTLSPGRGRAGLHRRSEDEALTRLNRTIPVNPNVRILWRGKNRITPFETLSPASTADAIQAELSSAAGR